MGFDQRGSEVFAEDECRRILEKAGASQQVGRLAVAREGSPHLIPVNFSVHEGDILVRLGPGYAAHHVDGARVTFEIDHSEPYSRSGWSVVVEGTARVMTYDEVARIGANIPHPIVTSPGMRVFRINPEVVTGRSVHPDHHVDVSPPSATWPEPAEMAGSGKGAPDGTAPD